MKNIFHIIKKLNHHYLFWLCLGSVIFLALTPFGGEIELNVKFSDKINHFFAFTILYTIGYFTFSLSKFYLSILLFLLGVMIEIAQSFISYRTCSIFDLLADVIGIVIGAIIITVYNSLKKKSR